MLSFEDNAVRTRNKWFSIAKVKKKEFNNKNDGRNCFDQPVKNNTKTYNNIKKIVPGQWDE